MNAPGTGRGRPRQDDLRTRNQQAGTSVPLSADTVPSLGCASCGVLDLLDLQTCSRFRIACSETSCAAELLQVVA